MFYRVVLYPLQRFNINKNLFFFSDSTGLYRDVWVRYVREHPVENNDWGDFQTHRRLLGLITVGKFENQTELNELCRVHESLKVKYTNTLFDSRCVLFGPSNLKSEIQIDDDTKITKKLEDLYTPPTNFKSRAFFYPENDVCCNLENNITEFISALFWILESKRLERSKEKVEKVTLLLAPFEKKDFVGLDMESRNNRKRCTGRATKHLADLTLQAGLISESLNLFHAAGETLRAISDSLWLGAANEGLCAASAIILYPNIRIKNQQQPNIKSTINASSIQNNNFNNNINHKNSSILNGQTNHPPPSLSSSSTAAPDDAQQMVDNDNAINSKVTINNYDTSNNTTSSLSSSSTGSSTSSMSSVLSSSTGSSSSPNDTPTNSSPKPNNFPPNILSPDEITIKYRDAIINYSKYRHAGIIETEAALKAARICIEQNQNLDVAMFLQNVLYINLNMNEHEKVQRFETLTKLYQTIGYVRKAAFCQRLAAWRHVAQTNPNPDWGQSYRLMLESFPGHRLSLDPMEVIINNAGEFHIKYFFYTI